MNGGIGRRVFVCGSLAALSLGQVRRSLGDSFDHLLLGVSDLDHGIDWFERQTGNRAPGGYTIEGLRFEHPRADQLSAELRALGLEANGTRADQARIVAVLRTPGGKSNSHE